MNTRSFAGQNQSLLVAQQQLESGQIEYATQVLNELLTKNPENVDALHLMSMAHYMQGNLIEAINCSKTACELMPGNITLLNNLGNFLKANDDLIPAKVAYERALITDRTCFPAQYNLGNIFSALNFPDKAIDAYKKAIKLNPKYADCHYNIGLEYSKQNDHRKAIDALKEAVKLNPKHIEALTQLGSSYCQLNYHLDAIKVFESALNQGEVKGPTYNNYGVALTKAGQIEKSLEILNRAVSMEKTNLDYFHNLGLAQAASGKLNESIDTFEKIIEKDKTLSSAYTSLAKSLIMKGNIAKAKEILQAAIKIDSKHFEAWVDLALCYSKQQQETECLNALEEARSINPDSIIPLWVNTICQLKQFSKNNETFDSCFENYESSLSKLEEAIYKKSFSNWNDASDAANFITPFIMILQNKNVKEIQSRLGKLLQLVMANTYPQWAEPPKVESIKPDDKIRIGVVSDFSTITVYTK